MRFRGRRRPFFKVDGNRRMRHFTQKSGKQCKRPRYSAAKRRFAGIIIKQITGHSGLNSHRHSRLRPGIFSLFIADPGLIITFAVAFRS